MTYYFSCHNLISNSYRRIQVKIFKIDAMVTFYGSLKVFTFLTHLVLFKKFLDSKYLDLNSDTSTRQNLIKSLGDMPT